MPPQISSKSGRLYCVVMGRTTAGPFTAGGPLIAAAAAGCSAVTTMFFGATRATVLSRQRVQKTRWWPYRGPHDIAAHGKRGYKHRIRKRSSAERTVGHRTRGK